jgi:hypothetical protein
MMANSRLTQSTGDADIRCIGWYIAIPTEDDRQRRFSIDLIALVLYLRELINTKTTDHGTVVYSMVMRAAVELMEISAILLQADPSIPLQGQKRIPQTLLRCS